MDNLFTTTPTRIQHFTTTSTPVPATATILRQRSLPHCHRVPRSRQLPPQPFLGSPPQHDSHLQFPISPPGDPTFHLHINLHPRHLPLDNGPQQGRRAGHLLEVGEDRRTAESVRELGVCCDGGRCFLFSHFMRVSWAKTRMALGCLCFRNSWAHWSWRQC